MLIFNSFLLLLRWLKGGKTKAKNGLNSVIYLLYNKGCAIYIVCDIIVIVVLTMCNLTISSILQNPN